MKFRHHFSKNHSFKLYDLSTLCTTIPYTKLKERLFRIIDNCFLSKSGTWKFKCIVFVHFETYFIQHRTDSSQTYTEIEIKRLVRFLIDNIYVIFGNFIFQQTVGFSMGRNLTPLLADMSLYSCEAEFIQKLLSQKKTSFTFRCINYVLLIYNNKFHMYVNRIYMYTQLSQKLKAQNSLAIMLSVN